MVNLGSPPETHSRWELARGVGCRYMTVVAPFFPRPEEVAAHGMTVSKRSNETHGFIQSLGQGLGSLV